MTTTREYSVETFRCERFFVFLRTISNRPLTNLLQTVSLCFAGAFWAFGLSAADLSGEWELQFDYMGDARYARLILSEENSKLSGTLLNVLKVEGAVTNETFGFAAHRTNGTQFADFAGKASGETLEGTGHWQNMG